MINPLTVNKTYTKTQLAALAGVSYSTFYRYLRSRRKVLSKYGIKLKAKILRGQALDYICRDYGITLPEDAPPKPHIKIR
jgi:hypothetical protein